MADLLCIDRIMRTLTTNKFLPYPLPPLPSKKIPNWEGLGRGLIKGVEWGRARVKDKYGILCVLTG